MNNFADIKERVRDAVDLSEWIQKSGVQLKLAGGEFKGCCPFHQDSTPSFTVFKKPDRGWRFHCFGCEADGDVFEFIMRHNNVDFMGALKLAANTVGITIPVPQERREEEPHRRDFSPEKYRALVPNGNVWNYLTGKRKLDGGLLVSYSVGETMAGDAYSFAYKWLAPGSKTEVRPRFEFAKVVKVERKDGKKEEWRDPKGGKNILFGMCSPLVIEAHKSGGDLIICEGELDAISWAQFGRAAVSVPGGAKYVGWIDYCYEWLQAFNKIHISFDEDAAGRMKLAEIVTRLGMSRTDIVRLPTRDGKTLMKDANECLQAGVPAAEMEHCLANAEVIKPEKLKAIYDFEKEIWNKLHNISPDYSGLTLPWGNFNGSSLPFRLRLGEVTVWTGYNKHGKSEVLNHVVVDLCFRQDQRAAICSLEVAAAETYRKLLRMSHAQSQAQLKEVPEAEFKERLLAPLADKIWVYDHVGYAKVEDVLNVMLYCYQRYGCRHFVLDSLMKFNELDGDGQQQWNNQRDFMSKLTTFASTYNVHVHLVAHSKKPNDKQGEARIPGRYDIQGSGYISNLPHNIIIVWRNRRKQDSLEDIFQTAGEAWLKARPTEQSPPWKRLLGGAPAKLASPIVHEWWQKMLEVIENGIPKDLSDKFVKLVLEHDSYVVVDAQRGGDGDTPARRLWFHYDSLQFLEKSPWQGDGPKALKTPTHYVALKREEAAE